MKTTSVLGKYLDQPMLVAKFSKTVPAILATGGAAYLANDVYHAPKDEKGKEFVRSFSVIAATVISAAYAPKLTRKIMEKFSHQHHHHEVEHEAHELKNGVENKFEHSIENAIEHHHENHEHHEHHEHEEHAEHGEHCCEHECHHNHGGPVNLEQLKAKLTDLVEDFQQDNPELSKKVPDNILEKAKTEILSLSDTKKLYEHLGEDEKGKAFLNKLIPSPEDIDSNHIFKDDLKRLSILGIFPVAGGIAGGILGDGLTDKNWKDKIPDKIKEGSYQYLANICLCNVGAGLALLVLEKVHRKSKPERVIGMVSGIILAGVVFGSAIANGIGKFLIDPLFGNKKTKGEDLFAERKPEALDMGLHVDDLATVALLSGLKWIEPALPILYSVSGYRAGIGYRNVETAKESK